MRQINWTDGPFRALRAIAPLGLVGMLALGCAGGGPIGGGSVGQDIDEIKLGVERLIEEQESTKRTTDYRLSAIEEKATSRDELMASSLNEIQRRIQAQNEEIVALRKEIAGLNFQLDSMATLLEINPARPPQQSRGTGGAPGAFGGNQDGALEAFNEAQRLYNLGRYDDAARGFQEALNQGLSGDRAIQAQYWLAESRYLQDQYGRAYEIYTQLITANPSHELAWRSLERLAEINVQQGRIEDALRLYDQIVTTNPGYEGIDRVQERIGELRAQSGGGGSAAGGQAGGGPGAFGTREQDM